MKPIKYFGLCLTALLFLQPISATNDSKPGPVQLQAKRTWTDRVELLWGAPNSYPTKNQTLPWKLLTQFGSLKYENEAIASAPASDGTYLYVSTWTANQTSTFYKYDFKGQYIEHFSIDGLAGSVRDLAYDGQYFYGAVQNVRSVFVMDFNLRKVVKTIPVDHADIRHLTFIPSADNGQGGLEIGAAHNSMIINKEGEIIRDTAILIDYSDPTKVLYGTAYANGYLYGFFQTPADGHNGRVIIEYNCTDFKPTGRNLDLRTFNDQMPLTVPSHLPYGIEMVEMPQGRYLALCGFQSGNSPVINILEMERAPLPEKLIGYHVYRNDQVLTNEVLPKTALSFIDQPVPEDQTHLYSVKAIYEDGESEADSTQIFIDDSKQLPFFDDFETPNFSHMYWEVLDQSMFEFFRMGITGTSQYSFLAGVNGFKKDTSVKNDFLTSRPLSTIGKSEVLLRYQVSWQINHPKVYDSLVCEIFDGLQWFQVDKIIPKQGIYGLEQRIIDVSERLANKDLVRIRFRISGPDTSNRSYRYYINEVRLWAPEYTLLEGTVSKTTTIANALIKLQKEDDIIVYQTQTDADGKYRFEDIEVGNYILTVKHPQYNPYSLDYSVMPNPNSLDISLKQPSMNLSEENIRLSLAPDKTTQYTLPLNNVGDGSAKWSATFNFDVSAKTTTPERQWPVMTYFDLQGNNEDQIGLYQGQIVSIFNGYPHKFLMKYSLEGEYLGLDTLPKSLGNSLKIVGGSSDLCLMRVNNSSSTIFHYNPQTRSIYDSIQIPQILNHASKDPITGGYYAGGQYDLFLFDATGALVKTIDIPYGSINIASVAVDTTGESPYLWIYSTFKANGIGLNGENMSIHQYSLDSNKLTGLVHVPNNLPGYVAPNFSKRQSWQATSMVGSNQYFNGKFVLIGSFKRTSNPPLPSQVFVYDMGLSVKWISMEDHKGICEAGSPLNFKLNINTHDLKHGESYQADIKFAFDPQIDPYIVPVTISIDTTVDSACFVPAIKKHLLHLDEYIDLEFEVKSKQGDIIDESSLLGFNIRRNGIILNDTIITQKSYRDLSPLMGENRYAVQAIYDFNCESFWSTEDSIYVRFLGECSTASNIDIQVSNQKHVTLTWQYPENDVDGISDLFESYEPFQLSNFGEWEMRDLDRANTYTFQNAQFPNQGKPMSFMVFNPSQCSPAAPITPLSGKQVLACFSTSVNGLANNDWLISPALDFDAPYIFAFHAMSQSPDYGNERIRVGYSTTGTEIEDFVWFNDGKHYSVPGEWTEYIFNIPANAKHVVLNCVTLNSFILLLDNLYVGVPKGYLNVASYEVFRNGERLMSTPSSAIGINDFALADGHYSYQVLTKYENGCVSDSSEKLSVDIDFTNVSNPVSNLKARYNSDTRSILVSWNEPTWSHPELLKHHHDTLAFGLGFQGETPPPFYVASAFVGHEYPFLMGYAFTGVQIGLMHACEKVTAFVICNGEILSSEVYDKPMPNSFTTVSFNRPVQIERGKTYLIGYKIEGYAANTFPAGSDFGPLVADKGNFISTDGFNWATTTELWGDDYAQNWLITAIAEYMPEQTPNSVKTTEFRKEATDIRSSILHKLAMKTPLIKYPIEYGQHETKTIDPVWGHQLYKNGLAIHETPSQITSYSDPNPIEGDNKYFVVSTYQRAGRVSSDTVNCVFSTVEIGDNIQDHTSIYTQDQSIIIDLGSLALYQISIYDLNGRLVKQINACNESQIRIPMLDQVQKTFVVVCSKGNQSFSQKVIIH